MNTHLFVHTNSADEVRGEIKHQGENDEGSPYAVLHIGKALVLFPDAAQLVALRTACDTAITDLRAAITVQWNDAHPEQPSALGRTGVCEICLAGDVPLFRSLVGAERELVFGCADCLHVDDDARAELPEVAA